MRAFCLRPKVSPLHYTLKNPQVTQFSKPKALIMFIPAPSLGGFLPKQGDVRTLVQTVTSHDATAIALAVSF